MPLEPVLLKGFRLIAELTCADSVGYDQAVDIGTVGKPQPAGKKKAELYSQAVIRARP